MSFVSISFFVFLFLAVFIYYIVPKKFQWLVLLIASLVFYIFSGYKIAIFLVITTISTYYTGIIIGKNNENTKKFISKNKGIIPRTKLKKFKNNQQNKNKKIILLVIALNIGILFVLKYGNFIILNTNSLLSNLVNFQLPGLNLILPLGISFYTFQSIGYIVDVYRGKYEPDKNFFKFALFLLYFPQIVQGPIGRYDHLSFQLYKEHNFEYKKLCMGLQLILWGMMKKLILVERVSDLVNEIFNNYFDYSGEMVLIGSLIYCIQAYADFSGGIDIAKGVSEIFGIELAINFNQPYFAKSVDEFWRRWHMTLGSWMRDYVFYPLSLSKFLNKLGKKSQVKFGNYIGKKLPSILAMFVVFLLVGMWHGADWKYIFYGLWNGIFIVSTLLLSPFYNKILKLFKISNENKLFIVFQMIRTFIIIGLGRYFSRGNSLLDVFSMFKITFTKFNFSTINMFSNFDISIKEYIVIILMVLIIFIVDILHEKNIKIRKNINNKSIFIRWLIYYGAIIFILIFGVYGPQYSVNAFIYEQF
jgi:D-alanyl-lipoteichoic acid acyltransferase DltB (MBOAT superfamily)